MVAAPLECRKVLSRDAVKEPGDFFISSANVFGRRQIAMILPDPFRYFAVLPIVAGPAAEPEWGWNGDLDAPSLQPSIKSEGHLGVWHGHLLNGKLIPC
jgi:hypothetical protein